MTINSRAKRESAMLEGFVVPDGTIDVYDKLAAVWHYSGIQPVPSVGGPSLRLTVDLSNTYRPTAAVADTLRTRPSQSNTYRPRSDDAV
jgi:hypothetical protein